MQSILIDGRVSFEASIAIVHIMFKWENVQHCLDMFHVPTQMKSIRGEILWGFD